MQQKTAIVFGATGSIGPAVCRALAVDGVAVAVHCRSRLDKAQRIVADITERGGRAIAIQGDILSISAAESVVRQVADTLGTPGIAVNLIYRDKEFAPKPVAEMEWADFAIHVEALQTHFHICRAVLPGMRSTGSGRIVYLSGGLAYRFFRGCAPYSAAKAGINAFCKTLALEEGGNGITVNIVSPGKVVDPASAGPDRFEEDSPSNSPMGRYAHPDDIAGAVAYLVSPQASYITGQTIYVAGGEIMPMP